MGGDAKSQNREKGRGQQSEEKKDNFQDVNKEIMSLYDFLETKGITGQEYVIITQPLMDAVSKAEKRRKAHRALRLTALFFGILISLHIIWQLSWIQKVATVLGRKSLLIILPWWDWTRLYHSDCVLTNPYYVSQSLIEDDCNVCESLERLDRLSNASTQIVAEDYLKNDIPFIVLDGMDDWPVMTTNNFWFDNITEIYLNDEQRGIYPCELTSNLRVRPNDLRAFLRKTLNPDIRRWYGHWENCDKKAAKALRPFYQRPYFIPHMVDLSDSNWVLMSSNYKGRVYKMLNYQTELLWVAQIRGWSRFRLVPQEPCDHYCPELADNLMEGQMVVMTSLLWKFEYIPGEHTDNFAIAVGGFWN